MVFEGPAQDTAIFAPGGICRQLGWPLGYVSTVHIAQVEDWRDAVLANTACVDNDLTCANHGSANLGLHKVHPPGPLFFGCGCEPGTGAESLTDSNRILSLLSLAFPHSLILLLSLTTTPFNRSIMPLGGCSSQSISSDFGGRFNRGVMCSALSLAGL